MKKFIVFLGFLITTAAYAQQKPQYTQYIFNQYLLNPALSGIENYVDFTAGYRKQWTGLSGAPQTSFVTANWALGDNYLWSNALTQFPEQDENPMARNYTQNYTSSPSHHGVGITAVLDKAGPISRLDANLTYAYHLQLNDKFNLSAGVAAGLSNISLDVNALSFEEANDPAVARTITNQTKPDLSMGIWLYGARLFAGVSVQQILGQNLSFSELNNSNQGKLAPHYFVTAGYKLVLNEDIAAIPSFMVKYTDAAPATVDLNLKLAFKDRIWLGGSLRRKDSFSAMAGFNVSKLVNLTYSYDFTTSDLSTVSNGSHEIVLGLLLNNIYNVPSRIKIW